MKMQKKILFTLIVLYASLSFLLAAAFAGPVDILRFEKGDTLEEIRAKIKHNGYNFKVDHNWVFDMSAEEKENFLSRHAPLFPRKVISKDMGPLVRHLGKALPSSFDWRNYNGHSYIGPVRDQGGCGSCYAFAACAAAEGAYNRVYGLYDGNCADFSESYIIWCLGRLPEYSEHFSGCDGADYDYYELEALTVNGVTSEAAFPYTTSDPGSCTHSGDPTTVFQSWGRISCNDIEAIKTAIMTYGAVDAAVYVVDAFQGYSGGIYEDSSTSCSSNPCYYTPTNHAIALVGWDDNGGDGYWILRNSWGTSWGESGYMRIKYTSASVACEATYLYLEDPTGLTVTPGVLSSEGNAGGPFSPAGIDYTLENRNDTAINYSVSKSASWVSIGNGGGSLAGHATTGVTVSINPNADSLSNGTYTDTIYFTNTTDHTGDTTRGVTLTVGVPSLQYSWNMDSDPGWTTEGQWAWGQPTGGGGEHGSPDPTGDYTGSTVYGYNLSGDYEANLPERHLTTGAINCTGRSRVTLKFRRWLGVEHPSYDHAYVRVSNDGSTWTTVWQNSSTVADSSWSLQQFDISGVADGHSAVYLRWTMGTTDDSWQYCGWNIDDVEIWAVGAPAVTALPWLPLLLLGD
ncbi:MAG: C1 family peptidase [Syntrophales bacterium]|nr:C1 family peptidase [Syntrophales bacterium]